MAEFYTNLPPKDKDEFEKKIGTIEQTNELSEQNFFKKIEKN